MRGGLGEVCEVMQPATLVCGDEDYVCRSFLSVGLIREGNGCWLLVMLGWFGLVLGVNYFSISAAVFSV